MLNCYLIITNIQNLGKLLGSGLIISPSSNVTTISTNSTNALSKANSIASILSPIGFMRSSDFDGVFGDTQNVCSIWLESGSWIVIGTSYNRTSNKQLGITLCGNVIRETHCSDRSTTGGWRTCCATTMSTGGTVYIRQYNQDGGSVSSYGNLQAVRIK